MSVSTSGLVNKMAISDKRKYQYLTFWMVDSFTTEFVVTNIYVTSSGLVGFVFVPSIF